MTVYDFFENFKDKGVCIIRIVDNDSHFDTRIDCVDKNHFMWRNFMTMYGNYLVTEWYIDLEHFLTIYIKEDNGEGRFDYNVVYTTKGWDEVRSCHSVHKSNLANAIEDAFEWGAYDMKISCVERKDDNA
jgi:hypothetical protein